MRAAEGYVRVIIRRPHAYFFLNEVFADEGGIASANPSGCLSGQGTELALPGLYVLDSEGDFEALTAIRTVSEVLDMLDGSADLYAASPEEEPVALESVSIRVSGFTQAEGIT